MRLVKDEILKLIVLGQWNCCFWLVTVQNHMYITSVFRAKSRRGNGSEYIARPGLLKHRYGTGSVRP